MKAFLLTYDENIPCLISCIKNFFNLCIIITFFTYSLLQIFYGIYYINDSQYLALWLIVDGGILFIYSFVGLIVAITKNITDCQKAYLVFERIVIVCMISMVIFGSMLHFVYHNHASNNVDSFVLASIIINALVWFSALAMM